MLTLNVDVNATTIYHVCCDIAGVSPSIREFKMRKREGRSHFSKHQRIVFPPLVVDCLVYILALTGQGVAEPDNEV